MSFMLRVSVEILPLMLPLPQLWLALALLALVAWRARRVPGGAGTSLARPAMLWTAGAVGVGSMAVTGIWL